MADLGTDIAWMGDLDPMFSLVSGRAALIQSIVNMFESNPEVDTETDDFGKDLSELLGESMSPSEIGDEVNRIEQKCLSDERVSVAEARIDLNHSTGSAHITIRIIDDEGPFSLVLNVTEVSVQVLQAE